MKNILCFFLILAGVFTFSQSTTVDAKITYNDGHSENTKVYVVTSLFDPKVMDIMSIAGNKITIQASDGKKSKILSTDIRSLDLSDLRGNERHFAKMPIIISYFSVNSSTLRKGKYPCKNQKKT